MSNDKTEFKVGDKVRLTGEEWAYSERDGYGMGTIHTVTGFGEDGNPRLNNGDWFIFQGEGYDAEVLASGGEALLAPFEQNVRRITDQIADLLIAKNKAYGDAALNPIRVFSKSDRMEQLYTRLDDKLSRVQKGHEYPGDDTIRDIIGYCTLILIAREGE